MFDDRFDRKLDALHWGLVALTEKVDLLLAAQDVINGADGVLAQFVALAPQILAAVQAGGTPVDTDQLGTDATAAAPLLAQIQAALPATPPASPPVATPTS